MTWRVVIVANGRKLERDCTAAELTAVGVELKNREESFRCVSFKMFVTAPDGVTHIIANRKAVAS
jgi:hypothetical protein